MRNVAPSRLGVYLALVYATGLTGLMAVAVTAKVPRPDQISAVFAIIILLIVVGELFPVRLWRQGSINEYTFSATFALVLTVTGPVIYPLIAQLCALIFVELRLRKPSHIVIFNVAQYSIAVVMARVTVCAINDAPFGGFESAVDSRDLLALSAAASVFFLINVVLTGTVLALVGNQAIAVFVARYLLDEFPITPIMLGLAPVVLACMAFSVWTVPLTLLLILALRRATASAAAHEIASMHDALTSLPNRSLLIIRLDQAIEDAQANDTCCALLMLDLDHFKEINDTLGHQVGDDLLCMVGDRLRNATRPEDTVARLGGDEFAIVLRETNVRDACDVATRLIGSLSDRFSLVGVSLNVEASVGAAIYPANGQDAETIIRSADVALYSAKETRGAVVLYDRNSDEHTVERLALMGELRAAIEQDELVVHYQPKIAVGTGALVSVEALVRWRHPTHGLLSPGRFIPAAENTGLINPLTQRVIADALDAVMMWREHGLDLKVAVNVTARQVSNLELPRQVELALASHGLPGSVLILEVTESCLMSDPVRARTVLAQVRALGVSLSIDDFGTGYSSFSNLRDLAVNEIKIDKSFVSGLDTSAANMAIVKSAIDLGHNLGLDVVAEGVETQFCFDVLAKMGCDLIQGYFFAHPMAATELVTWSRSRVGGAPLALQSIDATGRAAAC